MVKQRFILAEFPITKTGVILINTEVMSKELGLLKTKDKFGEFTELKVAEMDGIQLRNGKRFMMFFGKEELKMLAKMIVDNPV